MAKFLKNTKTGRVFPWTVQLGERADMVPCEQNGTLKCKADARLDTSHLTVREKVEGARKKADLIDIGAQFDIGFDERMKLKDMKQQLIDALIKKNIIQPTDEDVERLSGGGSDNDEEDDDDSQED